MFEELLKNKKANLNLIKKYGFLEKENIYILKKKIHKDEFQLEVYINKNGNIDTNLIEIATGEPYFLYKLDTQGEFVGALREEIKEILCDVINSCYSDSVYKLNQTIAIIEYIKCKYKCLPEFLWKKFPNFAVFRRKDNKKWFCIVMIVSKDKLGLNSKEEIEIINLKSSKEKVGEYLKNENIYQAYHMNKKSWYTIVLNNTIKLEEVKLKIDDSFNNAI